MGFDWERLAKKLSERSGTRLDAQVESNAAVAMVLRARGEELEVLLLQRAEREGDRWSGHISLPGGREEEVDDSLLATARRETLEETSIDLERTAPLLGKMAPIQARARGEMIPLGITPFVFRQVEESEIRLNEEAVASFWFPLKHAASGELSATFEKRYDGEVLTLPCWDFEGFRVWGLTHQMLRLFLARGETG